MLSAQKSGAVLLRIEQTLKQILPTLGSKWLDVCNCFKMEVRHDEVAYDVIEPSKVKIVEKTQPMMHSAKLRPRHAPASTSHRFC